MPELKSLREQIADEMKADIMRGAFQAGQELSISAIAKQWAAEEETVRDSLNQLIGEGFLEEKENGVYVSIMGRKDLGEIAEIRLTLELQAARVATPHIPDREIDETIDIFEHADEIDDTLERRTFLLKHDAAVHLLIEKYCPNERMRSMLTVMRDLNNWMRHTVIACNDDACEVARPEHLDILHAIKKRNPDKVQKTLRRHLERVLKDTLAGLDRMMSQK